MKRLTKTKVATYIKFDSEMFKNNPVSLLKEVVKKELEKILLPSDYLYKKSFFVGTHNDDVLRDITTILYQAFVYNKPRFLHNFTRHHNRKK